MKYFLTTAIDYVNGEPHLGHAYEKILADFFARYQKSIGSDVTFLTGIDEHGQKIEQTAKKQDKVPLDFCNEGYIKFKRMHEKLLIDSSRFARTTNPLHKQIVEDWLNKLHVKGLLSLKEHEGFFSIRQEQFVTEKDQVDGKWPELLGEVITARESNYFLELEPYRQQILNHLASNPDFIYPSSKQKELESFLSIPLEPLCLTRPISRVTWGIPVPFDQNYVTYVWVDALANYYSFAQNDWPADLQIIGKDILIPAHGVYWLSLLLALDLPFPKKLLVHGFWTSGHKKVSKSDPKSFVDPLQLTDVYGVDALRYYVLREMVLGQDSEFKVAKLEERYVYDLSNDLGNLFHRTLSMVVKYRNGVIPHAANIINHTEELNSDVYLEEFKKYVEELTPHLAIISIWKLIKQANQYIDKSLPWVLHKEGKTTELDAVLIYSIEACRRLSILIASFIPETSAKMQKQLGLSPTTDLNEARFGRFLKGSVNTPELLFPRIKTS